MMVKLTPSSSLLAMDFMGDWDIRFVSTHPLPHNVDRNDKWCRQRCCADETRPCHVLMEKSMVTINLAFV